MPLLADDQSAVLAPTQMLRFVWHSPRARTVGLLLKVLVAGAGLFLPLTRWRIPPAAAVLGAVAWANAAGVTLWLLYPLAETAAWLPWILLGLSQLLGVGGPATPAGVPTTALAAAAMLLAGHLPTAAQLLAVVSGAVVVLALVRRDVRPRLALAAAATLMGGLLAAPQVVPTAAYVLHSHALETRGAAVPAAALHLPARAAWSWLVPRGFGSPERGGYGGPLNFNEATSWVGIAPLFLALLVPPGRTGRLGKAAGALVIAAAAAAYGAPPFAWAGPRVPVLRWAAGQRWILLAQFGVAVLAAISVSTLSDRLSTRRGRVAAAAVGTTLLVLVLAHPALGSAGRGDASVLAARAVLLAAAELAAARGDGRVFPVGWVLRPDTGLLADLPTVTGRDDLLPERYSKFVRWAELDALDAAHPLEPGSMALIRRAAATIVVADRPIGDIGLTPLPDLQGPSLWAAQVEGAHPWAGCYPAALPVRDADQAFAILARTRLVDENTILVEGAATSLPIAPGLAQPLTARRSGPNRVAVECTQRRTGIVVLRETADPGWRARIDGAPTQPLVVDGMFLGALVRPGRHTVEFIYRPVEWTLGLVLAGLGAVALLATCAIGPRRQRAADVSLGSETHSKDRGRGRSRRLRSQAAVDRTS